MPPVAFNWTAMGDSKTSTNGWQAQLIYNLGSIDATATLSPAQLAGGAWTSTALKTGVDAWIAGAGTAPAWVLIDIGVNDWTYGITAATFNANLVYILDAIHTAWPAATVTVMKPWKRNYLASANDWSDEIDDVLSTRGAWATVAGDERVWLEGGDDGVTYTTDGVHPNAAGYALMAVVWQTAMGY